MCSPLILTMGKTYSAEPKRRVSPRNCRVRKPRKLVPPDSSSSKKGSSRETPAYPRTMKLCSLKSLRAQWRLAYAFQYL